MTSPLEAYLRDNPQYRSRDRGELLNELFQTSGVEEPYPQFAEKLLRDPDNPSGQQFAAKSGIRPSEEKAQAKAEGYKLGSISIFGSLAESAGRAARTPGDVASGKIPTVDPSTGHSSDEVIKRGMELGEWTMLPNIAKPGRIPTVQPKPSVPLAPNDPLARVVAHPERKPGELTTAFDRRYSEIKDKFHALNRAEKYVTGKWAGSKDPALLAEESPFKLTRLMQGNAMRAEHFLEQGTYDFATSKITGPSLKAIVDPVEGNMPAAIRYALSKRALEKEAQGKKSMPPAYMIEARKAIADIESAGTPQAAAIMKFQKELVGYNESLLKQLRDSGVIGDAEFSAIREANQDYLPFYRLLDERLGGATPGKGTKNPIKKMEGSELQILDPLESIIRNTYAFIHIAERNRSAQALYRLIEMDETKTVGEVVQQPSRAIQLGEAEVKNFLSQYDIETAQPGAFTIFRSTRATGGNVIEFAIDGKRKTLLVDPEIAKAWQQLDGFSTDMIEKWLGAPARMLRAGVTLDPGFALRNVIRDQFMPLATMPGVYRPFYDAMLGLSQIYKNGPHYLEWMRSGGGNSTMVAIDQQYLKILRERLVGGGGVENAAYVAKHPVEALRYVSNLMENATRVGGYMRARNQGHSALDAAFISREMTIDFARMGTVMQHLNRVAAFSNAQMEGPDRLMRAMAARPMAVNLSLLGGITAPSLGLWAMNHNDPRYKQMPRWQKDIYWPVWLVPDWQDISSQEAATLKYSLPLRELPSSTKENPRWQANYGKPLLIPKPFELGVIYGSLPERLAEKYIDDNPQATKDFMKSLSRAMIPNMMPTFMGPQLEIQSNYSFYFDRPIVSRSLERLVPELQYTEYTTETAKTIAKVFNKGLEPLVDDPQLTPIAVEHWVRNWTGTMGYYALQTTDWALRKAGVVPEKVGTEWTLADWPAVKSFTTRYPTTLARSIGDFYEEYFKQEKLQASIRELGKRAGGTEDQEILRASKNIEKVTIYYHALRSNAQMISDIMRNPDMPASDKRQLIDQHIFRMIAASQQGLQIIQEAHKKDKPEEREPQEQYESDLRMERFGAVQDNKSQMYMLEQMPLPEQLKFAPYAHADTKAKMIIWYHGLTAEQQEAILEYSDANTINWWLPYSDPAVRAKHDFSGPSLTPPNIRKERAPQPEKPAWGTRPPVYPKEGSGRPPLLPDEFKNWKPSWEQK